MSARKIIYPKAFTIRYNDKVRELGLQIEIAPINPKKTGLNTNNKTYNGIWDTGATNSVITTKVVNDLGLKPVGKVKVFGVNTSTIASQYLVDILLPNRVIMPGILVTETNGLSGNSEVLIGMDIIAEGDMSVSHGNRSTVFTFQLPSTHDTDYVTETNRLIDSNKKK